MPEKGNRAKKEKGASKTPPLAITERKPMEEEMKKLSSAIEQSIDGIAIGDLEPKLTYVNHAFARMHGYSREEMVGMKLVNLHNGEQMEEYKRGINQVKTQGSWEGEIGHIRKDGAPFPTYMSVTLLKGDDEKPKGIVAVATDITEHKQTEEELRESEERLKILFEYAPDAYYLNDSKGNFVDGNKAAEEITGYKREELIGKSFLKLHLLPRSQTPRAAALLVRNALGKATGPDEFILNRKDGSQVPLEIRTFPVKFKGKTVVLGIARDITERKQAKEALRESEERYRHLFDDLSDAAFLADVETGLIVETNQQGTVMLGRSRNEIVGMHQSELHPPGQADKYRQKFTTHIQKGHAADFDGEVIRKDGTIVPVRISASTSTIRGQRLILGLFHDIT